MPNRTPSLPELLQRFLEYRSIVNGWSGSGDIPVNLSFLQPTTLLPLWAEALQHHVNLDVPNPDVRTYVRTVIKGDYMPSGKSYLPLVQLPSSYDRANEVASQLKELSRQTRVFQVNSSVFEYVLSELIDNIYQHAKAGIAFALAQYYPAKAEIEMGFLDTGMTIPRSLSRGKGRSYPLEEHFQAILDALDGTSSKEGTERGYGLGTSLKLMTKLGGSALIVSGCGAVYLSGSVRHPYALSEAERMPGTLVSIQLPDSDKEINLYELVEG